MNKKIIILLLIVFILGLICVALYFNALSQKNPTNLPDFSATLLSNSEWISIIKKDIVNLSLDTYTASISQVISSLENGVPVVAYIVNGRFDSDGVGNFIVLTSFNSSGDVNIVVPNISETDRYFCSLGDALEYARKVLIFDNTEVLK